LHLRALRPSLAIRHNGIVFVRRQLAVWLQAEWRSVGVAYSSIPSHSQHCLTVREPLNRDRLCPAAVIAVHKSSLSLYLGSLLPPPILRKAGAFPLVMALPASSSLPRSNVAAWPPESARETQATPVTYYRRLRLIDSVARLNLSIQLVRFRSFQFTYLFSRPTTLESVVDNED